MHDEHTSTEALIVAADHLLAGDIDEFLTRLQLEQRFFGPTANTREAVRPLIACL
ncbi:MAG: hypothetical protein R2697_02755 [Ilumatobacteraceae bacterium]